MSPEDPIARFLSYLAEAVVGEAFDATRCALATATADGCPSVRFVLCKEAGPDGFVVYTNYGSRKARELEANPRAALCFHWASTGVQVRVEGRARRAEAERSDAYFAARPRGSQLGAWASPQSEVVDPASLARCFEQARARFDGAEVPRPDFWGGYVIEPEIIEFWHNRDDRMHDRYRHVRDGVGWRVEQLAP